MLTVGRWKCPLEPCTQGEFLPPEQVSAEDGDVLVVQLGRTAPAAAPAAPHDSQLQSVVRELRGRFPGSPVALWIPEAPPQVVVEAVRAACQAQVRAIHGGENLDAALLRVQLTHPAGLSTFVLRWASDAGYLPAGVEQEDVRELLEAAPDVRTLERLCSRRHIAVRSCRSRLQQLGLPTPSAWLGLAHALHVAFFVQRNHHASLQSLCDQLGMQTLANMTQQFRRVFGLSPSVVRALVGAEPLLHRWFQARLVR